MYLYTICSLKSWPIVKASGEGGGGGHVWGPCYKTLDAGCFFKTPVASPLIQCCVFQFTKYYTATVMSLKEGGGCIMDESSHGKLKNVFRYQDLNFHPGAQLDLLTHLSWYPGD